MFYIVSNPLRPQLVTKQDRYLISELSNWGPVISELPPQLTERGGVELSLKLTHQVTTRLIFEEHTMRQHLIRMNSS